MEKRFDLIIRNDGIRSKYGCLYDAQIEDISDSLNNYRFIGESEYENTLNSLNNGEKKRLTKYGDYT